MSIELNEKDVRAIASNRFFRKWRWWMVGSITIVVVVSLGLMLTLTSGSWTDWFFFTPLLLLLGGVIWVSVLEEKAKKALVEEWKSGSVA